MSNNNTELTSYQISHDNGVDYAFTGELLGMATLKTDDDDRPRWTELNLYRTEGGSYICEEIGHSSIKDEVTRRQACVASTIDEVVDFFGDGWLASKLYQTVGFNIATHVA